ncbi:hypothetical protein PPACK8108_LOCUS10003 [Phakopsora pachyrhizi]|uniref:Uncharacterized protein n=1 Tax=Phakopsora pachyrhizi TaxID=170000 RepID=A0AAV0B2K9_PHAPC|nr:hypothetical protein PPACK8108_LOCUS10003 [Phakopsora pachyrhizi]
MKCSRLTAGKGAVLARGGVALANGWLGLAGLKAGLSYGRAGEGAGLKVAKTEQSSWDKGNPGEPSEKNCWAKAWIGLGYAGLTKSCGGAGLDWLGLGLPILGRPGTAGIGRGKAREDQLDLPGLDHEQAREGMELKKRKTNKKNNERRGAYKKTRMRWAGLGLIKGRIGQAWAWLGQVWHG